MKPQPQRWFNFSGGKSGLKFGWVFRGNNRFSVELYIDTRDREKNKAIFDYLFRHKNDIERAIGLPISWERLDEKRASRITIYKCFDKPFRALSVDEQEELIKWGIDVMQKFFPVFSEYIKKLPKD